MAASFERVCQEDIIILPVPISVFKETLFWFPVSLAVGLIGVIVINKHNSILYRVRSPNVIRAIFSAAMHSRVAA